MTDAKRDQNRQVAWMGISSTDNITPIPLTVDATTGRLRVKVEGNEADPTPGTIARRDENRVTAKLGTENTTDFTVGFVVDTNTGLMMDGLL